MVGRKNIEFLVGGGMVILKKWKEASVVEEEKVKRKPRGMWVERNLEK